MRITDRENWLVAIRRYIIAMTAGNLVWEVTQLPLYTVWRRGRTIGAAVILGSVGYTIYSEYANTVLRVSWAYGA